MRESSSSPELTFSPHNIAVTFSGRVLLKRHGLRYDQGQNSMPERTDKLTALTTLGNMRQYPNKYHTCSQISGRITGVNSA